MSTVSVIMPYFKKKKFFKKAYFSALNQKIKNLEIIIIYDDEDCAEINYVKKIINKRKNTILIINKKNLGVAASRNIGIYKSKGYYISFLDCDDVWKPNKLKYQINYMKKNNLDISYTSYSVINEFGRKLYNVDIKNKITYKDLLKSCDIGLTTVVMKKSIFNFFKFSNIKTKEDYLLWLQLSKSNYKFLGIQKLLSSWRVSQNSLSSNIFQKIGDAFRVYYKYEGQNFLNTIISVILLSFFSIKKNKFIKL